MKPVYAVGVGPGPVDLLTVRAEKLLRESDRVYILGDSSFWVTNLVSRIVPSERLRLYRPTIKGWERARDDPIHDIIAAEIAGIVKAGQQVSVAAPGDVGFYSSFGYLEPTLATRGVAWEYVPGVSFMQASSLVTHTALVDEKDTLVVSRITRSGELDALFRIATAVVLYDVPLKVMKSVRDYAIEHELDLAQVVRIGPSPEETYAINLLSAEAELRRGFVILRSGKKREIIEPKIERKTRARHLDWIRRWLRRRTTRSPGI
jgi:precorrin-2/cobalt-factor-2 C20-methyltransferase